ncbi:uncharacterized protein LOC131011261 [Salvia miltiorrhiza]|uniref:uncharacterized protein LOC131011261 n=1 Tax=Salvia miltiorrhiza TaxID=226208 RepID=UPI0025AC8973|nr:uncharacterized protein LOC131011261 [Salvia miltiorrhiza]
MLQQKAQVIFQARSPISGPFNYENAWRMLRINRRFKSMYLEGDVHFSKRTKTLETGDFTTSASGEEIMSFRPIGNKAAARAAKGKASQSSESPPEFKEMLDRSNDKLEKMMGHYTKKNELKKEIHDDQILFIKTDGMDPETLEIHKARVAKIVARLKEQ